MARKVKYTKNIRPIALPASSDQDYTGKYLITSGWGKTKILYDRYGDKLDEAGLSDVPKKTIVQAVEHNKYRCEAKGYSMCEHCGLASVICTYGKRRYNRTIVEDACSGDSGGEYLLLPRCSMLSWVKISSKS